MPPHLQAITRLSNIIAEDHHTPSGTRTLPTTAEEAMSLYKKVCETHITPLFTTMKEFAMTGLSEEERTKADALFNDIKGINIIMKKPDEEKPVDKVEDAVLPTIEEVKEEPEQKVEA